MGPRINRPIEPAREASGAGRAPALTFAEIYDAYFTAVSRWVRLLGGAEAEREDLTQEVFLAAQRSLDRFDGQNLAGWLYQITKHKVSDHRRSWWWGRVFRRNAQADLDTATVAAPGADHVERRQQEQILWRLIDRLALKQRGVFVLFEIEGLSGQEIAQLEGIPLNTVWTRLHAARKSFFAEAARVVTEESAHPGGDEVPARTRNGLPRKSTRRSRNAGGRHGR